ncbi:putative translation initiation factor IF-2 [Iris pallida]|uniref:Translation initiation factor IF-2 n=1 Tax=Iris pallida TaxID=29817 RepID=A0AAX6E491_IRIPA|nr:putative translation initiation factor IF-2 [Iris pallida]KAJ6822563.1 putative translation initiation factor IF-2 [Iris pallida]
MDFSPAIAADSVFSNLLLQRHPPSPGPASTLSVSAVGFLTTDSAAPPVAVRSDPYLRSVAPRALVRRSRRTRRKPLDLGDDGDDGLSGDGDDGSFGGGGGGGRDWGFGGSGPSDWEDHGRGSPDPAFDFVYEVILWIALSNCTLFAFRKVGRILEEREKVVPIRLVPSVC